MAQWSACASQYTQKDLTHYLTVDAARDLDWVRKLLGYSKIHVEGTSYGSRVALEYLRQFEANTASVVIDGVVPPDFDFFESMVKSLAAEQEWMAGEAMSLAALAEVCDNWKVSATPASLRAPVESAVPVLLLSGTNDYKTPPDYAKQAATHLSNSKHITFSYLSHGSLSERCARNIVTAFVTSDGNLASLNTSCVQSLTHPNW